MAFSNAPEPQLMRSDDSTTLVERAYRQLRTAILRGHLTPGQKLKMEGLQRMTGLSNSPLREALTRLAIEDLVSVTERRGFRVASICVADLRDVTRMRLLLEPAALEDSIAAGDDAWQARIVAGFYRLEIIEQRIVGERLALNDEWTDRHRDFHMALLSGCRSPRMLAQIAVLFDQAERYRRLSAAHRKEPRNKLAEHRRLMDLVLKRDRQAAVEELASHLNKTVANVERVLDKVTFNPASRAAR